MRQPPRAAFAEKEFYLDEFHEKSVLFALRAMDWTIATRMHEALEVFATLLRNDTRVLLLLETSPEEGPQRCARALHTHLSRVVKTPHTAPVIFCADASIDQLCLQMWEVLRDSRIFVGLWPSDAPVSLADCAQRVAVGLRVYKLVYLDPLGGLAYNGKILSFMSGPGLQDLLQPGRAEEVGLGSRRPVLEAIRSALVGGVMSVSLCPLAGLERELFTYEGYGTLFTRGEYCQVEKLGIDDFHEVEKLLQRAEQAGYLKPRTLQETARLLLYGYSARLGVASMEPAGFCALLPYAEDHAAEIVGLITITRYQGEGVGGQLVEAMIQEGTKQGLTYVFACTTQEGAQRLFTRHGFQRVPSDAVAAAKWQGYDPARLQHVAVYRRELTPSNPANTVHHPLA
jgi:amino-acid N-acetyltransferase